MTSPLLLALTFALVSNGDDAEFSGPQPGEKLPGFEVAGVYDDLAGKSFDPLREAGERPLFLIFVHKPTRPSIGLTRALIDWTKTREKDLASAVVWLSDDRSEAEQYLTRARGSLGLVVPVGVSLDGAEGPGALGLNRKMTLTILVAKAGVVTANFALVQPSDTDAPKIFAAIVAQAGGEAPALEEIRARRAMMAGRGANAELGGILRRLFADGISADDVAKAAARVDAIVAGNRALQAELAQMCRRFTGAEGFEKRGSDAARKVVQGWVEKYGKVADDETRRAGDEGRWRELLSPIIRKDSSDDAVLEAIAAVEEFIRDDPGRQRNLGERCRRITSGRIFEEGGYGGDIARAQLRAWAEKLGKERREPPKK